jgi:peroxiredoxin-like protein
MGKLDKQILFEVQLNWITGSRGLLSAKDALGTLHVAAPPAFGGEGKPWTPEHLFLSAISSCFMTTYLAFCQKLGFEIANLSCEIVGQVEIVEGRYKFTTINLYPKIYIEDESLKPAASKAMEKTHKYCLITNSVNADVFYHSEILLVDAQAIKV